MRYLVRFGATTPLRLPEEGLRIAFAEEQLEVWALPIGQRRASEWIHIGLEFRIWVEAADHTSATTKAKGAAETIACLLTTAHGTGIALSGASWTIDLDDTVNDRVLVQHFDDVPTLIPTPRPADPALFARLVECWSSRRATDPTIDVQLRRAMWHLRKAAMTDDLVEEFNEIWLGLESVNHLLVRKHDLQTRFVARHCDNCGAPMEVTGSSAGIMFAMKDLAGATPEEAKIAHRLRKVLHHGLGRIYEDRQSLPDVVPLMRNALVMAFADITELPQHERSRLRRKAYVLSGSRGAVTVSTTLYDLPVQRLMESVTPPEIRLSVEPPSDSESRDQGGRRHFGPLRIGVVNHDGRWGNGEITWVGRRDPELDDVSNDA